MTPVQTTPPVKEDQFSGEVIEAFENLAGSHPGFRPAHAKGILLAGTFTPSPGGASLTRAPHLHSDSTPITVRFSDFAGVPNIPDNSPDASPRGIAIRLHLGEHVHTDIIGHSVNAFPTRTAEEFVEFLHAAYASASSTEHPSPIEAFLGTHPAALQFVTAQKPIPTSFAKESFFPVCAYKFINSEGVVQFGRYRIVREGGTEYLDAPAAAAKGANFLMDEIAERVAKGPVKFKIMVQLAVNGDVVDDATIHWPEDRPQVEFGSIEISSVIPKNISEQRRIIFDTIPRVDGIESSGDPLLEPRAAVYLTSGRRRRAAGGEE